MPVLPDSALRTHRPSQGRIQQQRLRVEEKIQRGDPAVARNDEIGSGVSRRLARTPRHPWNSSAIAQFFGLGNWLIPEIWMSRLDRARHPLDLVAASVGAAVGVVEHAIFGEELVDRRPPPRRVVFTENVAKIAYQQSRNAI